MLSLQTKNKKLKRLIKQKVKNSNVNNFSVTAINLSSHVLTEKEQNHLKYGVKYRFIDCNRNVKKYLAAELETLDLQNLIYKSKDYTYHDLNPLIKIKDLSRVIKFRVRYKSFTR